MQEHASLGATALSRALMKAFEAEGGPARAPDERPSDRIPEKIGRFTVHHRLGHGGMGEVYRAHDDRLQRDVAIKRVHPAAPGPADIRLMDEARALAKLSHPNVVTVHDVGECEGELFIEMELIEGQTLAQWALSGRRQGWRACVRAYLQAGRGLAAAHASGLVHRDFKPSNCIIDKLGCVRVLDFGLARRLDHADDTSPGGYRDTKTSGVPAIVGPDGSKGRGRTQPAALTKEHASGTPEYMAPEQSSGHSDAKSDQFSFCVSLYEAIHHHRPFGDRISRGIDPAPPSRRLPRRLHRALRRGLSIDPEHRWPSMEVLLGELERSVRSMGLRARSWAVSIVGASMSLALVAKHDPCADATDHLVGLWDEGQQAGVRSSLTGTRVSYAEDTWRSVKYGLDGYHEQLFEARLATCRATLVRSHESTPPFDLPCLRRREAAMRNLIEVLSSEETPPVDVAVQLVDKLPAVGDCNDAALARPLAPSGLTPGEADLAAQIQEQLDRASYFESAALLGEGESLAEQALAFARALGHGPLIARAGLGLGHLQMIAGHDDAARATLRDALEVAQATDGADDIVVGALAILAHVVGVKRGQTQDGLRLLELMEAFSRRSTVRPRTRASLLTAWGQVLSVRGEHSQAQSRYEGAIAILKEHLGPEHLALANPLDGLAQALHGQGQLAQALDHRRRAFALQRAWLGDHHPSTAFTKGNLAKLLYHQRRFDEAQALLVPAIDDLSRAHGPDHKRLAPLWANLAGIRHGRGDHAGATEAFTEALRVSKATQPEHVFTAEIQISLAEVLMGQGRTYQAQTHYRAALGILEKLEPTRQIVHWRASVLRGLGRAVRPSTVQRAEQYFTEAQSLLNKHHLGRGSLSASLFNQLGKIATARGDTASAVAYHQRAFEIYTNNRSVEKLATTERLLKDAKSAAKAEGPGA